MNIRFRNIVIAFLVLSLCLPIAACDLGGAPSAPKLVMSELSYSDSSKVLSWNEVPNAVDYTLKINGAEREGFTSNGTTVNYVVEESAADTYTVSVVAIGDGINYSNSDPATKTIDFTLPKTQIKLVVTGLDYDDTSKLVSWDKLEGASGYNAFVDDEPVSASSVVENGDKMQFSMSQDSNGYYWVSVVALGSETATHIYTDSDKELKSIHYTKLKADQRLPSPTLALDASTGIVHFNSVANASGYLLTINGETTEATYNQSTERWEYQLPSPCRFTAVVYALGGNETAELVYINSYPTNYTAEWEPQLATPNVRIYDNYNGTLAFRWDEIANADTYLVAFTGADKSLTATPMQDGYNEGGVTLAVSTVASKSVVTLTISGLGVGAFNGTVKAVDSQSLYLTSDSAALTATMESIYLIATAVAAGERHSVAIDKDGYLWTWGSGTVGQLGNPVYSVRDKPLKLDTSVRFVTIAAGDTFNLAIDTNGDIWSWGSDQYGALGDGATTMITAPKKITNVSDTSTYPANFKFTQISAGLDHSLALGSDRKIYAWGRNNHYQVNGYESAAVTTPTKVTKHANIGNRSWKAISAGHNHSVAITYSTVHSEDGLLFGWGDNTNKKITSQNYTDQTTPLGMYTNNALITGKIGSVCAGAEFTAASFNLSVTADKNQLARYGLNSYYLFGYNTTLNGTSHSTDTYWYQNYTSLSLVRVYAGASSIYALTIANGTTSPYDVGAYKLYASGNPNALGNGSTATQSLPAAVLPALSFTTVSAYNHALAIDSDGQIWAFGSNSNWQTAPATNPNTPILTPERVLRPK